MGVEFSVLVRKEADQHAVDPAPSNNRIEPTDDNVELRIERGIVVLNFGVVPRSEHCCSNTVKVGIFTFKSCT